LLIEPGFDQRHGVEVAPMSVLDSTIGKHFTLLARANYPLQHSISESAKQYRDHFNKDGRSFSLFGNSMGTPLGLGALAMLVREGEQVPHLNTLIMNCSPCDTTTIQPEKLRTVEHLARLHGNVGYWPGGGALVKPVLRVRNDLFNRAVVAESSHQAPLIRCVTNALIRSMQGSSPPLCVRQAHMYLNTDPAASVGTLAEAGVITDGSRVIYIASDNRDATVKTEEARRQWQTLLEPVVGTFDTIIAGDYHVDPAALTDLSEMLDTSNSK
jgi:pimeloyl-ACP methyl ester carboxylesterase